MGGCPPANALSTVTGVAEQHELSDHVVPEIPQEENESDTHPETQGRNIHSSSGRLSPSDQKSYDNPEDTQPGVDQNETAQPQPQPQAEANVFNAVLDEPLDPAMEVPIVNWDVRHEFGVGLRNVGDQLDCGYEMINNLVDMWLEQQDRNNN